MATTTLGKLALIIGANTKQFETALQRSNRQLSTFGKNAQKMGRSLSIGVSAPIAALGAVGVKTFAGFEQSMAKVKAVSGATTSQFSSLKKNAQDLGASTRFTASQVADLQLNFSKLGLTAPQIEKVTGATLNLALATGEDLAQSATVAASTLKGFGLSANEMGRVTDVMAKSFSSSALDLEKFSTAMASVAPTAKNAGLSIEDTTGFLSVLVDRGVDASSAGSALRNIFLDLAKSGMSFEDAMAQINTSSNKNATALDLFGKRGATVASILAENQGAAALLTKQFNNSAGAAAEMAAIMDNTLEGSLKKVGSAFESMFIAVGENLAPAINKIAGYIANLASKFSTLSPSAQKFIMVAGGIAAAIGPILFGVGKFIALIPILKAGFATMLGPVGLVIAAVAALGTAFIVMANKATAAEQAQSALDSVALDASKSIAQEKSQLEQLISIAKDDTKSRESRLKAVKKLNEISPEYLGNLNLENIATQEGTTAINAYTAALEKRARVQAAQEKLVQIEKDLLDVQDKLKTATDGSGWSDVKNVFGALNPLAGQMVDSFTSLNEETVALNAQKKALLGVLIEEEDVLKKDKIAADGVSNSLVTLKRKGEDLKTLGTINIDVGLMPSAERGFSSEYLQSALDEIDAPKLKVSLDGPPIANMFKADFATIATAWEQLTGQMEAKWTEKTMQIRTKTLEIAGDMTTVLNGLQNVMALGHENAMASLDQYHENQLRSINASGESEKTKQEMIQQLNAKTEQKRKVLAIKRAKHEKAIAVMNAIINTASAVAQALPNYILAAAVAALGAAQIGLIAGTPVPALAKGGLAYGPTLAMVGDNPGASSNPEVIAPLNKLKSMIGGRQNINISVSDIIVEGSKLRMVLNATDRLNANTF